MCVSLFVLIFGDSHTSPLGELDVCLGLPGVVIANVAIRSAASGDPGEVTLVNGQIVRESDRPRYMPGADLWDELIVVNRHLYRLQLNDGASVAWGLACDRFLCGLCTAIAHT